MNLILKRFVIRGLYDERDVDIEFSNNFQIIVAENGYGKTTVLNALYATLSGDVVRLRKIEFRTIEITFADGKSFKFDKSELQFTLDTIKKVRPIFGHLSSAISEELITDFFNWALATKRLFPDSPKVQEFAQLSRIPPDYVINIINELQTTGFRDRPKKLLADIKQKFPYNIVYLPTYRRVEQDFKGFNLDEKIQNQSDHAINFGMRDVTQRFAEITKEITSSSVEWFSKVNGEMLEQLAHGFHVNDNTRSGALDHDAIKIVLDRIGSNIKEPAKKEIIRLVETKAIFESRDHEPLLYFITNLLKVYEQQKNNDKAIQDFSEVCNKYLVDKMIKYDESKVTIDIVRRKNGRSVEIENLSSGEKQIISLFARLYLKKESEVALFFDEPELSLSIEWQRTLLPDIINSGKCAFMFTTTHSPFIFENELALNATDLGLHIRELYDSK